MLKPSFYDSEKVVPALEFYDDKGVRLRSQRNLNCDVITTLNKGQSVRPYAKSDVKFEIDGEQWYWYKIVTEDRKIGWVYGKYLDIAQ